jgi:hypothetical protein
MTRLQWQHASSIAGPSVWRWFGADGNVGVVLADDVADALSISPAGNHRSKPCSSATRHEHNGKQPTCCNKKQPELPAYVGCGCHTSAELPTAMLAAQVASPR